MPVVFFKMFFLVFRKDLGGLDMFCPRVPAVFASELSITSTNTWYLFYVAVQEK